MKDITKSDIENNINLVTRQDFERKVMVGDVQVGGDALAIMAGPCTIESKPQIEDAAKAVKDAGANILRGGVFKPLTFPYGDPLGQPDRDSSASANDKRAILSVSDLISSAERRFAYFKEAGDKVGLPIVSEVTFSASIPMMSKYVDMFQIGYRHMFNMDLILALSEVEQPLLIKRHYGESLRGLLGVAEHFEARGKHNFIFCERGVAVPHTHNVESRAVLDIQAISALKEYAPTVPVVADPSHSTFKRRYVADMARAAIAAGADGILIDVHEDPETAWVDPLQALNFSDFKQLVSNLNSISKILQ